MARPLNSHLSAEACICFSLASIPGYSAPDDDPSPKDLIKTEVSTISRRQQIREYDPIALEDIERIEPIRGSWGLEWARSPTTATIHAPGYVTDFLPATPATIAPSLLLSARWKH